MQLTVTANIVEIDPDSREELANIASHRLPNCSVLDSQEVGEVGKITGTDGALLEEITEGPPEDLASMTLNDNGKVVDANGAVTGRAGVLP